MISKELMIFLKKQASSQGVTQQMLAKDFGVSLATVKRWYAGIGLSLEQASAISTYLGISLGEALNGIKTQSDIFFYTKDQELFFSKNPKYLAYFDNLIRGKSPNKISKEFSINEQTTLKYLLKLDKLGLIELHKTNKIKLKFKGEPTWMKDGPLSKIFKSQILDSYMQEKKSVINKFHLYDLTDDDVKNIEKKVEELLKDTSRANNRNSNSKAESRAFGINISLKEYRWSIDQYLR